MNKFHVRLAEQVDIDEILRLQVQHSESHFELETDWQLNAKQFLVAAIANDSCAVAIAEHPTVKGKLVAMCSGTITQVVPAAWLPDGRLGYMQTFYTQPEWRKQGIGEQVIAAKEPRDGHLVDNSKIRVAANV